ncbi:MAG: DUF4282 domain-containing protein [Candidatus Acidiferrales bacterium]
MAEDSGFFQSLMDLSFQHFVTPKYSKLVYALHLLVGLIVAIGLVFNGFQISQSQGLLVLLLALVGYFFWILYVRIVLEFLVAAFRTADNIARVSGPAPGREV